MGRQTCGSDSGKLHWERIHGPLKGSGIHTRIAEGPMLLVLSLGWKEQS